MLRDGSGTLIDLVLSLSLSLSHVCAGRGRELPGCELWQAVTPATPTSYLQRSSSLENSSTYRFIHSFTVLDILGL